MKTFHVASTPKNLSSCVLGNIAIWWGSVVGSVYAIGFALLMPNGHPNGLGLPLEFPLIGIAIAMLGVLLSAADGRHRCVTASCVWGLVVNAVPLSLAMALRMMR